MEDEALATELEELFADKGLHYLARDASLIADIVKNTLWLDQVKWEAGDDGWQRRDNEVYDEEYNFGPDIT